MPSVREAIKELCEASTPLTTKAVASRAEVSRQAAQKQLKALVAQGELRVEGKARAAKYFPLRARKDLWAKVATLSQALEEMVGPARVPLHAQAQMPRLPTPELQPAPPVELLQLLDSPPRSHQKLEVASAGSLYRLSARLLLSQAEGDRLTVDFTGVAELGEEFVEELDRWVVARRDVAVSLIHLKPSLTARLTPRLTAMLAGAPT